MKFKKIVSHGIPERLLEQKFWQELDSLCEKRILLNEGDARLADELTDADCLLVWFNGANKEIINKASNLKYIGVLATGYGKIDTVFASSKGITITNVPAYSTESVAELVLQSF
jgi:glycerate dehydrogenase